MTLNPKHQNPLKGYVDPSTSTDMSLDGCVVDRVYAATGVLDRLSTNQTSYNEPTSGQVSGVTQPTLPAQPPSDPDGWTSSTLR